MGVAEEDLVRMIGQAKICRRGGRIQHVLVLIAWRAMHELEAGQLAELQRSLRQAP